MEENSISSQSLVDIMIEFDSADQLPASFSNADLEKLVEIKKSTEKK